MGFAACKQIKQLGGQGGGIAILWYWQTQNWNTLTELQYFDRIAILGIGKDKNCNTAISIICNSLQVQLICPYPRSRDKLIGIHCTQTPINWNCKRCLYLELQFLKIANPRIAIPKNCNSQNCNTLAFIAV